MLPKEFLNRYGQPTTNMHVADGVNDCIIPPDVDRYLLSFWSITGMANVIPTGEYPAIGGGALMVNSSRPITLTHALHGSLVNLGWTVSNRSPGSVFVWIEARMRSGVPGSVEGIPLVATPTNTVQSVTQNLPPAVIPPFEYVPPEPIEVPDKYKPWIPSEDVPVGTYRLIQRLTRPGEYRTPTREEMDMGERYNWDFVNIDQDGFFAVKRNPRYRY